MSVHAHTPEVHEHADSWHHHAASEGVPQQENGAVAEPAALIKWFAIIVGVLAGLLIVLFVYFDSYNHRLHAKRVETLNSAEANVRKAQAESRLGAANSANFQYVPVDGVPGKVHLPLDRAAERVVEKYGKK